MRSGYESGRAICRGDAVFQPRHAQPPALNANEMILASELCAGA
ncbi:DUF3331 domain-containing protein [Burkholderia sp. Bp8963]|nr:DUF3331 domain-containing protein [Burkholderia sp. Bp8963]